MSRRRIAAVVRRNYLTNRRDPGQWFLLAILPAVDALLFTSFAAGSDPDQVPAVVAGLALFHVIWQVTIAASMGFLDEVWSRNLLNLAVTPLRDVEMFAAYGFIGLVRSVISTAIIATVAAVFYGVDIADAGAVLAPAVLVLVVFAAAVSIAVIGLVLQYGDRAEVFSWGTLVLLLPFSGVFYPIDALPSLLRPLARIVPLFGVFDAIRGGLAGDGIAWQRLATSGGATVVVLIAATMFYRRQLRRFRCNGWITRFS